MQENVRGCTLTLALVMTIKCYITPERSLPPAYLLSALQKGADPGREHDVYSQLCPLRHFKKAHAHFLTI